MRRKTNTTYTPSFNLPALAFGLSLCTLSAVTAAEDLPDGRTIIEKGIDVAGGRQAFEAIETLTMMGTISMTAADMQQEIHSDLRGKFRIKRQLDGADEFVLGSDGQVAWMHEPSSDSYTLYEPHQLAKFTKEANLQLMLLSLNDRFETIETVERSKFGGQDAYQVYLTDGEEPDLALYFGIDDQILLGFELETPETSQTYFFLDYELVSGVKMFKTIVIEDNFYRYRGSTIDYTSIFANTTDTAIFELPDGVKELVAEK